MTGGRSRHAVRVAKVLDIAAGHGAFGIAMARRSPKAQIVALDWKPVLGLAEEHAKAAGVHDRFDAMEAHGLPTPQTLLIARK